MPENKHIQTFFYGFYHPKCVGYVTPVFVKKHIVLLQNSPMKKD